MHTKTLAGLAITVMLTLSQPAMAQGSVQHSGQALKHSVEAIGHTAVAGMKLSSAAVAVPLGFSAGIGHASGQASEALWENANAEIGEPLIITDETIVAGPTPDAAIKD